MKSLVNKSLVLVLTIVTSFYIHNSAFSQTHNIPIGYYDATENLSGDVLKQTLHNIIDDHTEFSYDALWTILKATDQDPNNSNNFILIYTGRSLSKSQSYPDWNREHVWAKSHGDFGTSAPAGTDAHHLRPSDVSVNSARGNKDFDEGGTQHSEATECYYTSTTWEPRDAVKGDIARMMFYMTVRYEGDASGEPDLELVDYVSGATTQPIFGVLSTLIKWHQEDPVDDFEINRNEVVYSYQKNRNPFIDHPEFVSKIWGGNSSSLISAITHTPEEPSSNDEVNVSATITDDDGITSVTLNWGIANTNLTNAIVMSASNNTYSTTTNIPAQSNGTAIYYQIKVTDAQQNITNSSINHYTVGGEPAGPLALLNQDFETSTENATITLNGWQNYNETGTTQWIGKLYNKNRYAQITAFGSGEELTAWLITPEIDLTQTENETFTFDINIGYWKHNGFSVWISSDFTGSQIENGTWTDISSNFSIPTLPTNSYGTFTNAGTMDLSSFSGTIHLAFKYEGNESGTSTLTTTYQIDNVLVQGTESVIDSDAPQLTVIPADNEIDVSIENQIVIQADEALYSNLGNVLDLNYIQEVISIKEFSSTNEILYNAEIAANQTQIILTPEQNLAYETSYIILIVDEAFTDDSGNKTPLIQSNFTTEEAPDLTAPNLNLNLENNATQIPVDLLLVITSNEPLFTNNGSTIDGLYLNAAFIFKTENGNSVAYTATTNDNKTSITVTPNTNFNFETTYYFEIPAFAFTDASGNRTAKIFINFTSQDSIDTTPPVLSFTPQNGAENVELTTSIQLAANEILKSDSGAELDEAYIISKLTFSDANGPIDYSVHLLGNEKQMTLVPYNPLNYETQYTLTLTNQAFSDMAGNKTEAISYVFTTKPELDLIAPSFSTGYPAISDASSNGFKLKVKITEPGKVFYLIQKKEVSAATKEAILAASSINVDEAYKEYSYIFTALEPNTEYAVYLLTQDKQEVPNTSENVVSINVNTHGLTPTIIQQPESLEICKNTIAIFSVRAEGSEPLTYQWFFNNLVLDDANSNTLTIENADLENSGNYYCSISNPWGEVSTDNVILSFIADISAGIGTQVSVKDTVAQMNLNHLLLGSPAQNGEWTNLTIGEQILDGIFYPSRIGAGIFNLIYRVSNACITDTAFVTVSVVPGLSAKENSEDLFVIYPNPSSGEIYVSLPLQTEDCQLLIYALDGKLIRTLQIKNNSELNSFKTIIQQKGTYLVKLSSQNHVFVRLIRVE